jgi:hypothetical protein
LIANFEVATGKIIAPSIGETRTNEDFASHIEKTIATDPATGWIFVVDQLNIHQSEALVKLIAGELGIELELDSKGNLKHITRRWLQGAPSWQILPTASVLSTLRSTPPGSTRSSSVVFHPGAQATEARQLHLGRGSISAHSCVHRVLQPDNGQAVQVDLPGTSAQGLNRWVIFTVML